MSDSRALASAFCLKRKRLATLMVVGILVHGLAGCGSNALSGFPFAGNSAKQDGKSVAFAPIVGAPVEVANQLSSALVSAVEGRNVAVSKEASKSDYTVRGYLVASPDQQGTKLSYIWDVTDKAGSRAHRIKGEELLKGKKGADPWSMVEPKDLTVIAEKTAIELANWLPKGSASENVLSTATPGAVDTQQDSSISPQTSVVTGSTRKAIALPSKDVYAVIPTVSGAPGDGKKSLTNALKKQLYGQGIKLASKATPVTYTVKGDVTLGKKKDNKQSIQIDWEVIDPAGRKLGTVSQKNSIPEGSLDGAWGKTADAAAAAAAQGILKLLPKPR